MKYIALLFFLFSVPFMGHTQQKGEFSDPESGRTYETVKIGQQTWMVHNWKMPTETGSCIYYTSWGAPDSAVTEFNYGKLYLWETALTVCPDGWHLPIKDEWQELFDYLGGKDIAGNKMKDTISEFWTGKNAEATNESGFSARAGSYRMPSGKFYNLGYDALFWTSTERSSTFAYAVRINYLGGEAMLDYYEKDNAASVRCLKDYVRTEPVSSESSGKKKKKKKKR